jgi:hypothetical protein
MRRRRRVSQSSDQWQQQHPTEDHDENVALLLESLALIDWKLAGGALQDSEPDFEESSRTAKLVVVRGAQNLPLHGQRKPITCLRNNPRDVRVVER